MFADSLVFANPAHLRLRFKVPFVQGTQHPSCFGVRGSESLRCGCRNLGEALRRIAEGWAMGTVVFWIWGVGGILYTICFILYILYII